MKRTVLLQEASPSAGIETTLQTGTHPTDGLLAGYLLRCMFTIVAATGPTTPTYRDWCDTILDNVFPVAQIYAPRYSQQFNSANIGGGFWAKQYEDTFQQALPIEVNGSPVTPIAGVQISTTPLAAQVDLYIPFELPKLGSDRMWACPPASLFRGDVTAKVKWAAAAGTIGGQALTVSAVTFRWMAKTAIGDNARVPVVHRFERRTYAENAIDIGRGFPVFVTDNRAPDQTIQYNNFIDGEARDNGAIYGEDLIASYRFDSLNQVPEQGVFTPLHWMGANSGINDLQLAARAVALQLVGASSGTLDLHFMDPPSGVVIGNCKAALGIPKSQACIAVPVAPNTASLGNVVKKVAYAGPRTLFMVGNGGAQAISTAAKTVPTVPGGTTGAAIASSAAAGKA